MNWRNKKPTPQLAVFSRSHLNYGRILLLETVTKKDITGCENLLHAETPATSSRVTTACDYF